MEDEDPTVVAVPWPPEQPEEPPQRAARSRSREGNREHRALLDTQDLGDAAGRLTSETLANIRDSMRHQLHSPAARESLSALAHEDATRAAARAELMEALGTESAAAAGEASAPAAGGSKRMHVRPTCAG